jgi:hypothetical protein
MIPASRATCGSRSVSSRRAGGTVGADRRLSERSPENRAALITGTGAHCPHEDGERQRRDNNIGGEESVSS